MIIGWLYQDQLNPVAEVDSLGNITTRFVYGSRAHVPDYLIKDSVVYKYITDHLGSVRFVVNLNTGAIVQELEYDEFGKVLKNTNESFQPFGYAGGLYDHQTGLIRFGARDYYAAIGRWTTKDPIGFYGGGTNLYVYVKNLPLSRIDPLGLTDYVINVIRAKYWSSDTYSDQLTVTIDGSIGFFNFEVQSHATSKGYFDVPSNRTYSGEKYYSNKFTRLLIKITDPCDNKIHLDEIQPKTKVNYKEGVALHYGTKSEGCILFKSLIDERKFMNIFENYSNNDDSITIRIIDQEPLPFYTTAINNLRVK